MVYLSKESCSKGSLAGLRRGICDRTPTPSYPPFPSPLDHLGEWEPTLSRQQKRDMAWRL